MGDFDDEDEGYVDLSCDDIQARRILSLAVEFMNARGPLPFSTIERHYPDIAGKSALKAFRRDRERLAACGIHVVQAPSVDGQAAWRVDEGRSFVQGTWLSQEDALLLDVACLPLVSDPEFGFRDELRIALAKVDHAFSDVGVSPVASAPGRDGRDLVTLRGCMTDGCAALITYTRADGQTSVRKVAPFGLFGLRGRLYMVAPVLDDDGTPQPGSMRTYLLDRVRRAERLDDLRFSVPSDFDVADWRRLPFQLGDDPQECLFRVPNDALRDLVRESMGQGRIEASGSSNGENGRVDADEGTHLWRVEACDLRAAASWAVANGITPLSPPRLVDEWHEVLRGVTCHGC